MPNTFTDIQAILFIIGITSAQSIQFKRSCRNSLTITKCQCYIHKIINMAENQRRREKAAEIQLLSIQTQDEKYIQDWDQLHSRTKAIKAKNHKSKIRTENNSPKGRPQMSKQQLKKHLLQLKKASVSSLTAEKNNSEDQAKNILKQRSTNTPGCTTVQEIYLNKQKSEQRIRPLVYVDSLNDREQIQQQKIRLLIKRKVQARNTFRKKQNTIVDAGLPKQLSQNSVLRKNTIINCTRLILPHIF